MLRTRIKHTVKYIAIVFLSQSYFPALNAQDGVSTFDGTFVDVPSIKVNGDIYNNVFLQFTSPTLFTVPSTDEAIQSTSPAAAEFDGTKLLIRNLKYQSALYSNIQLKYEDGLDFTLVSADIPQKVHKNSYFNRTSNVHINYEDLFSLKHIYKNLKFYLRLTLDPII